jgi:3-methylcrotonyl-CoA carboxylase alpha subunit
MFDKILIANRGEIACRVAATAHRLGVRTVAVYSEIDARSKHVAACDEAVHIGGATARESYLRMDRIIAAAKSTGAKAIHPGYGFLSENAAFATLCATQGLVFIGPPASAIAAMGLKSAAKTLMEQASVPLVPGYHGADQTPAVLQAQAERIGYPVLIKASAGGGGKGMRVVARAADFLDALGSCQREARNAFGDEAVLVEKYLTRPRHIEVQIFGDSYGHCLYLFERDCSVQRRHQKVMEEAPAPGLSPARRRAMGEAAVAAAKAVGYVGAGTVEFIVEGDAFYFMEMNTRLQVEHPVTEMITGFDLVEWQLRVAAGERLTARQEDLTIRGHALEARLYAENPEQGFLPSVGTLRHLRFPEHVAFVRAAQVDAASPAAVRVDSGVRQGDTITPNYDPMIAKLITWGENREQALHRMSEALGHTQVVGPSTNVAFLKRLVESAPFAQADLDTGLIARNHDTLFPADGQPSNAVLALACAGILSREVATDGDPWSARTGFRLNQSYTRALPLLTAQGPCDVRLVYTHGTYALQTATLAAPLTFARSGDDLQVMLGSEPARGTVVFDGDFIHVFSQGLRTVLELRDPLAHADPDDGKGGLVAPMPGKVVSLLAQPGTEVKKGAPLLVMEAMKMEHTLTAPSDGTVAVFLCRAGDQVAEGAALLEFTRK